MLSESSHSITENELLNLPLPFNEIREASELTLNDLKTPHIFDRVKNDLNQERFFSLIHLDTQDEILKCRKAEMLINIQSFEDAVRLLESNKTLLGAGLLAKALLCLKDYNAFEELVSSYIWQPLSSSQKLPSHEQEGFMHIYNMAADYASRKDNLPLAKFYLQQAEVLAKALELTGRLGVIYNFKAFIYQGLGLEIRLDSHLPTGNFSNQKFDAHALLISSWSKGKPEVSLHTSDDYKILVKAWKALQNRQLASAEEIISSFNGRAPDVSVHRGLLGLSLVALTKREFAGKISDFLRDIKSGLSTFPFKRSLLTNTPKLHPLGVLLAANLNPELKEMSLQVPLLVSENYRDGLRLPYLTVVLPNEYRKACLEDDAYEYRISQKQLLDKSTRHRANKSLRKHQIEECHIVTAVQYFKACQNLACLGYEEFYNTANQLLETYPKVKKYI
ncbi:MAG: hypothetical protein KC422_22490 [Trueperaceae bacterium]|nr:hypothetical protein [Trueperaceae bacterium]